MGTENTAEPIRWCRIALPAAQFTQDEATEAKAASCLLEAALWELRQVEAHLTAVWPHPQNGFPWGLGSSESSRSSRQCGSQKSLPLTRAGPSAAEGCKLAGTDVGGLGGFSGELGSLYVSGLMFNSETATLTILREGCPGPHFTHEKANTERGHAHPRLHSWQVGSLGPQRSQL